MWRVLSQCTVHATLQVPAITSYSKATLTMMHLKKNATFSIKLTTYWQSAKVCLAVTVVSSSDSWLYLKTPISVTALQPFSSWVTIRGYYDTLVVTENLCVHPTPRAADQKEQLFELNVPPLLSPLKTVFSLCEMCNRLFCFMAVLTLREVSFL